MAQRVLTDDRARAAPPPSARRLSTFTPIRHLTILAIVRYRKGMTNTDLRTYITTLAATAAGWDTATLNAALNTLRDRDALATAAGYVFHATLQNRHHGADAPTYAGLLAAGLGGWA